MTALPKTRRRIFFYASALAFLAIAPFLILYSLGYTIDIKQRTVQETGGIFVKTNLTGFTVSLNNGAVQKYSLITHGLLINNLVPGQYRARIEKVGYQPWERVIPVTQFSVREIRNIILLPDPIVKTEIAAWSAPKQLKRAFISPAGTYAAVMLYDTTAKKYSLLFLETAQNAIIAQFPVSAAIDEIRWNETNREAILALEGRNRTYARVILSPQQTYAPFFETKIAVADDAAMRHVAVADIKKITFGNTKNNFIILTNANLLLSWNAATTSAVILAEGVMEFKVLGDDVFFIAQNGFAARQSLRDRTTISLGRKGYAVSDAPIQITRSQKEDIFLQDSANGLFFSPRENNKEFELIETGVQNIALDGRETKLFFKKQNAIGVLYLEDNPYQPFEKRGDKNILLESRDTEFLDAAWYTKDNAHIILNTAGGIFLLDTDTRSGPRIAELDAKPAEKIFWNRSKERLYLIRATGIETLAIE
jgi:hypothetical protein